MVVGGYEVKSAFAIFMIPPSGSSHLAALLLFVASCGSGAALKFVLAAMALFSLVLVWNSGVPTAASTGVHKSASKLSACGQTEPRSNPLASTAFPIAQVSEAGNDPLGDNVPRLMTCERNGTRQDSYHGDFRDYRAKLASLLRPFTPPAPEAFLGVTRSSIKALFFFSPLIPVPGPGIRTLVPVASRSSPSGEQV